MTNNKHKYFPSKSVATKVIATGLGLIMIAGLAGCDTKPPQPVTSDTPAVATSPRLSSDQEKKIEQQVRAVISQADASKNPDDLNSRVEGPALAIRRSQLTVARATNTADPKMEIPTDVRQTVLPIASSWPRYMYAITSTTADQQSERLLVLNQDSARDNYKLWGLVRLFSGVSLPKFPIPSIGTKIGVLSDSGLVATPEEAVKMYADVLQNGNNSASVSKFNSDQFQSSLADLTASVQKSVAANKGSQTQTFTPNITDTKIMRTADGGDLVVAQIDSVWVRSAGEGRQAQTASSAEKALFNSDKYTSTMRVTYTNVVALYIPPASSSQKMVAVGAERQPIKVEAI